MDGRERVLVLGLGTSGFAAAELAAQRGAAVTVLDAANTPSLRERAELLHGRGTEVRLDWNEPAWQGNADLIVISPGIPPDSLLGSLARATGAPLISELEYGFRYCSCPVLAVTGTNGKTTTVELLAHCLRHAGYHVLAAGNIGTPLCEAARKSAALDFLVVEVSSFQLEHIDTFAPLAAALLNVTPDHLNRYRGFDDYLAAKLRLFQNMNKARCVVLREDLTHVDAVQRALPKDGSRPISFAADESLLADLFLAHDNVLCQRTAGRTVKLLPRAAVRLVGRHNVENVLAVMGLAQAAGLPPERLAPHVTKFAPSSHRLELVAVHNGVRFINDSKATNVDALCQALVTTAEGGSGRVLLIAGGVDKGLDFAPVAPLLAKYVKDVFLIGSCRERLAKAWHQVVSCKMFVSLAAAVDAAADSASAGDTVLLSPGCASQDMFTDYAERGRTFTQLVRRRIGE